MSQQLRITLAIILFCVSTAFGQRAIPNSNHAALKPAYNVPAPPRSHSRATSIVLDNDIIDSVYTGLNSGTYKRYKWFVNSYFPNDSLHSLDLTWAASQYDTLYDANTGNGYKITTTNYKLDSVLIPYSYRRRNTNTRNDTVRIRILSTPSGVTVNPSAVNGAVSNTVLATKIIVLHPADTTNGGFAFLTFATNLNFPTGGKFAVNVDFFGDTVHDFALIAGYDDACSNACAAAPSVFANSAQYRAIIWQAGADYSFSTPVTGDAVYNCTSCQHFYIQNIVNYVYASLPTPPPPTVTISGNTQICSGSSTTLTATGAGGTGGPYTYTWTGGTTGSTKTVTTAGTYSVTVSDGSGTATASVTTTVITCGAVCTPNPNYTTPGLYPASDSLPCIVQGQPYSGTIYLKNFNTVAFAGTTLSLDSVRIDSITNLPCGITWQANKASRMYMNSESGCFQLSGTSNDAVGQYKQGIYVTAYPAGLGGQGFPQEASVFAGFRKDMRVKAPAGTCPVIDTFQTGLTAQTTCSISTPLSVSITGSTTICTGGSTTLTAVPTGGSGTYTYAWSGGGTTSTKTVTSAGTYSVTVNDGSTTATSSVTVTVAQNATLSITSNPNPPCAGQAATGTATATNTGGSTITWYVVGLGSVGTGTTISVPAGTTTAGMQIYAQTTPVSGCPATVTSNTITVSSCSSALSVAITGNTQICSGGSTTLTAAGSGGTGNYTYTWTGGSTGSTLTVTSAGTYSVTVNDGSTTATNSATTTVINCGPVCTPNPAYTQAGIYPGNDSIPCIVQGQPYSSTIYLKNFDQVNVGITVTIDSIIVDSIKNLPCGISWVSNKAPRNNYNNSESGCIQLSGTSTDAVGQYLLRVYVSAYPHSLPVQHVELGSYGIKKYLRVSSGGTCALVDTNAASNTAAVVCANQPLQVAITGNTQFCIGGSSTLTAAATGGSGTYTYSWSGSTTGATKTVTAGGTYSVTVNDGITTATASVTVTTNPPATISISSLPNPPCASQSATFNATTTNAGTGTITWFVNGNQVSTGATYTTATLSAGNTVTASIAPSGGCPTVTSTGINVVTCAGLSVSITGNTTICAGSTDTLTAVPAGGSAPYSYLWSNNSTNSVIHPATAGAYTVTVTDAASHTAVAQVTTTVINCGNVCTPDPSVTQPGIYPSASDSIPCIVRNVAYNFSLTFMNFTTVSLAGTTFTMDSLRIDSINNLPCNITWTTNKAPNNTYGSGEVGCIKLSGTTTDPVGQYKLDVAVTAYIHGLGAIPYNASALGIRRDVRVKASAGACAPVDTTIAGLTANINCAVVQPPTVTIGGNSTFCQGSGDTLTAVGASGQTPYTYHWSNNSTSSSIIVAAAGTYGVTLTDANNNTATASIVVTSIAPATISISSSPNPPCNLQSNTFTANVTNGGNSPVVTWYVNGTQVATGATYTSATLATGNSVTASVTPSTGCAGASSNQIFVSSCSANIDVFGTGPDTICAGGSVTLGLQVSGGTGGPYTYSWSPAAGLSSATVAHPVASPTVTTPYVVVVSDGTNTGTDTTVVVVSAGPSVSILPADVTICTGSSVTLVPTITNTSGTVTYAWGPSTGLSCTACQSPDASPVNTTVYTITVTEPGAGCSATASLAVHVTSNATTSVSLAATRVDAGTPCEGSNFFSTTAISGGQNPTYQWTVNGTTVGTSNDTITLDGLQAGDIVRVVVTSSLSCANPATAMDSLVIGTCSGIEEVTLDQHVKVYPNPNNGQFVLAIDQSAAQMDVQILNVQGRIIYAEHIKDYMAGKKQFNLGELAKGVYMLKVSTENGSTVKRLVIQ